MSSVQNPQQTTPAVNQNVAAIETLTDDMLTEARELAHDREFYRSLWQDTMAERDRLAQEVRDLHADAVREHVGETVLAERDRLREELDRLRANTDRDPSSIYYEARVYREALQTLRVSADFHQRNIINKALGDE